MSRRFNDGSYYENHQRADELHDGAAHARRVGEQHGKQDHLTAGEHSHQQIEHSPAAPVGHGVVAFGHNEIAALAHELWQGRGCPAGSSDEDWFRAVAELRSRNLGH